MITPAWRILRYRDFPCLLCLVCNRISHHPNDVRHRYCSACNLFLEEVPEFWRSDNVEGQAPGWLLEGVPESCPTEETRHG